MIYGCQIQEDRIIIVFYCKSRLQTNDLPASLLDSCLWFLCPSTLFLLLSSKIQRTFAPDRWTAHQKIIVVSGMVVCRPILRLQSRQDAPVRRGDELLSVFLVSTLSLGMTA